MRELKGRINSVSSSQKITGAMKMISSARLRKAELLLMQSRPYQQRLWEMYHHIPQGDCGGDNALTLIRQMERLALVVYASDDGLAGAFNMNVYKKLLQAIQDYRKQGVTEITVYPVGKKLLEEIRKIKEIHIRDTFVTIERRDSNRITRQLSEELTKSFLAGEFDRVDLIYTHYKSMGTQHVEQQPFLPLVKDTVVGPSQIWFIYEPDCKAVLEMLFPLLLHALMYKTYLESQTSEQAARILAMQLANENANKLLDQLHLEYNKLRQQGITSELLDIAGGTSR